MKALGMKMGALKKSEGTVCLDVSEQSRQQRWRAARLAAGRCPQCGRGTLDHYRWACDSCAVAHRRRRQARLGVLPWHKGGRGRPPLTIGGVGDVEGIARVSEARSSRSHHD